jgi:hypothetical protein
VARLPLTFLASPRKCKQKKATAFAALRVPACASQKMGNERNSPAAQTAFISDPFSAAHKRLRPKRNLKINFNVKTNVKTQYGRLGSRFISPTSIDATSLFTTIILSYLQSLV